jgi:ketosteroid isomerase-like protein
MAPTIESRLQALEDERAILRVLHTYGHAIDYGDEPAFVDLWDENALLFWPSPGEIRGRATIRAAFRAHTHAPEVFHKHLLIEPLIFVDGDAARSDSMFARLDPMEKIPSIRAFGRYRDRFRRCEDGKWRFTERRAEVEAWHPASQPTVTREGLEREMKALGIAG